MAHKGRARPPDAFISSASHPAAVVPSSSPTTSMDVEHDAKLVNTAVFKGPKRKRLVKACDACHKSKRRCDGKAPCGNCYYASKECTYTDAAGRPVPAPHAVIIDTGPSSSAHIAHYAPEAVSLTSSDIYAPAHASDYGAASTSPSTRFIFDDGKNPLVSSSRKRPRDEHAHAPYSAEPHALHPGALSGGSTQTSAAEGYMGIDRTLLRELVNVFFAHCHPQRLMIHHSTFTSELALDRLSPPLLNAVCALAAPLSQAMRSGDTQVRLLGLPFAQAAQRGLFDSGNNLVAPISLATAHALCLLQAHKIYVEGTMAGHYHFFEIALRILRQLDVHKADQPIVAQGTSVDLRQKAIERECLRRTFWFIYLVELLGGIFARRPMTIHPHELQLRLPCDEAGFELGPHSTIPEYLSLPAPRTRHASEFGQLIRVAQILHDTEKSASENLDIEVVLHHERKLNEWVEGLPEHLRYSPDNLHARLYLWDASSNTTAWCYAFLHALHAATVLAISDLRSRKGQPLSRYHQAALDAVPRIISAVGYRARNSVIMGIILWLQYCGPHAPAACLEGASSPTETDPRSRLSVMEISQQQWEAWRKDWEELWGPVRYRPEARPDARRKLPPGHPQERPAIEATKRDGRSSSRELPGGGRRSADSGREAPQVQGLTPAQTTSPAQMPSLPSLKASGLLDFVIDERTGTSPSQGHRTPSWMHGSRSDVPAGGVPGKQLHASGLPAPAPPPSAAAGMAGPSTPRSVHSATPTPVGAAIANTGGGAGYQTRVYTHMHSHAEAYYVEHPGLASPQLTKGSGRPPVGGDAALLAARGADLPQRR